MTTHTELALSLVSAGFLKTPRIIEAFRVIDRSDFVLPEFRSEAGANIPLPAGEGQLVPRPSVVAFMLELLEPQPGDVILDVGSGLGWTIALLSQVVGAQGVVVGVELVPKLHERGGKNIGQYNTANVRLYLGDATKKIPEDGPFDKIIAIVTASGTIPDAWKKNVKVGGRIVAPVDGLLRLHIKKTENEWEEKKYPGFVFTPLIYNT